jgi:hypothetical protein
VNGVDNQMERSSNGWSTNFWLVQALLIVIIAAGAFFAGRAAQPMKAPDSGKPIFHDDPTVVSSAEKLLETARADHRWTPERDGEFKRFLFRLSLPARLKLMRGLARLVNSKVVERVPPQATGKEQCPTTAAPDPCASDQPPTPAPAPTTGAAPPPAGTAPAPAAGGGKPPR